MKFLIPGLILFLLFLLMDNSSFAQKKSNLIGLSFGSSTLHLSDEHASPIIFSGTGIAPTIQYSHKGDKNSHSIKGSFYYTNLYTSSDNFKTEIFSAGVRYSFLHSTLNTKVFEKQFKISLGGSVTSFFLNSDYFFYLQTFWARSIASWYWSHSADLAFQLDYYLTDRKFLYFEIYMPMVSNVSRPPYSSSGDYDYVKNDWVIKPFGHTVFFPENFSVSTQLVYQHPVMAKVNLRISYEFYYISYSKPEDIRMYMNNFRIGIFYVLN